MATFDYFVNSCGGIISGQKVTITSPNYPESYQQNTKCAWFIELPDTESVLVRIRNNLIASISTKNYKILKILF